METKFTILIADRNPRIHQFLERELVSDGYHVLLAKNRDELASMIWRDDTLDLLVVDDEILRSDDLRVVERLSNRIPPLPFIIHTYSIGSLHPNVANAAAALVEKTGNLEELKRNVKQAFHVQYPRLFAPANPRVDWCRYLSLGREYVKSEDETGESSCRQSGSNLSNRKH